MSNDLWVMEKSDASLITHLPLKCLFKKLAQLHFARGVFVSSVENWAWADTHAQFKVIQRWSISSTPPQTRDIRVGVEMARSSV